MRMRKSQKSNGFKEHDNDYVIAAEDGIDQYMKNPRQQEHVLYLGPPPPSGTVQVISCVGTLTEHVLHCKEVSSCYQGRLPHSRGCSFAS